MNQAVILLLLLLLVDSVPARLSTYGRNIYSGRDVRLTIGKGRKSQYVDDMNKDIPADEIEGDEDLTFRSTRGFQIREDCPIQKELSFGAEKVLLANSLSNTHFVLNITKAIGPFRRGKGTLNGAWLYSRFPYKGVTMLMYLKRVGSTYGIRFETSMNENRCLVNNITDWLMGELSEDEINIIDVRFELLDCQYPPCDGLERLFLKYDYKNESEPSARYVNIRNLNKDGEEQ